MIRRLSRFLLICGCLTGVTSLSSCASKEAINLKIHTDPEGSHIVYRVVQEDVRENPQWTYLGVTPYQGITLIDSGAFDDDDTISFKVMRHGYLDQTREWTGGQFMEEYEKNDVLFWTPRLVKAGS